MIYNQLIKHNSIISKFENYLENNNLPHSFIFYGNNGVGKFGHALEFASMLLCKQSDDKSITVKKIKNNLHANINFILPLPRTRSIRKDDSVLKALSDADIEHIQNQIRIKLDNPYHNLFIKKANTILINSIRDIRKRINLSNLKEQWNIHIIIDAEKMCFPKSESANALLKVLEEPHPYNLFILLSSNISQVLDTLISRCTKIFFPTVEEHLIKDHLIEEIKIDNNNSNLVSKICCGDISLAIDIAKNFDVTIANFNSIINLLFHYDMQKWQTFIKKFKNQEEILDLLNLLELFFLDIISYKELQSDEKIRFIHLKDKMLDIKNKYDDSSLLLSIDMIHNLKKCLKQNVYSSLLFSAFYLEINQALNQIESKATFSTSIV